MNIHLVHESGGKGIIITVDNVEHKNLLKKVSNEEQSRIIKKRVLEAQNRQLNRLGKNKQNASMSNREIKAHSTLTPDAKEFIDIAAERLGISARVYMKMIKLGQTIADLEVQDLISKNHIAEALQYRPFVQD